MHSGCRDFCYFIVKKEYIMDKLNISKKSVLGNMIIRQTMGGTRKEDKIKDKDNLIERIREEYDMQNSKTTYKLDLTMLDVSLVEDMSDLFSKDCEYSVLKSIDVSNWDMHNVRNMYSMFRNCYYLESVDVSKWDTGNVKDMSSVFCGCSSLKSIDVSKWDVSNVENLEYMFYMCMSLDDIDISKWDVSNVKDMYGMFYKCSSLKSIDVSKWDVSNVKDIHCMFYGCNFDYIKEGNKLIDIWRIWTV